MEHPDITRALSTGYPYNEALCKTVEDALGHEVYVGDRILMLEDDFFLVDELSSNAIEVLEHIGATYHYIT